MSQFNEVLNKKAVALKYDENRNAAPVIVASGMGYLAEKIVEVANDNGVPMYEDNSLATVLTQLNLGSEIPEELYQAVVDIYAYFLKFVPKEPRGEAADDASAAGEQNAETADSSAGGIPRRMSPGAGKLSVFCNVTAYNLPSGFFSKNSTVSVNPSLMCTLGCQPIFFKRDASSIPFVVTE